MNTWNLFACIFCVAVALKVSAETRGYDLPVLPRFLTEPGGEDLLPPLKGVQKPTDKYIPRNVWIAVRNASDPLANHMNPFMERNKNWTFHVQGNFEKDDFMETYFANTSVLWAYSKLNPQIGCSKPEIWRLAVLYIYGGLYMDDDSNIATPLDEVVHADDKFIIGKEDYNFDDRCYIDSYPLSNHSMNIRFGSANQQDLLGGKFFFNWAFFSAPRHPIILRTFQHIVALIRGEYIGRSLIKMKHNDHRGKLLMCATTFPISHSARELVLEAKYSNAELGLRVGDTFFKEYGAQMKAWYNDGAANHWVKVIQKHHAPYLIEYGHPPIEDFDGQSVQAPGQRAIYLIRNGTRYSFPDFQTFVAMNFTLDDVHVLPHSVMNMIPIGPDLPPLAR